MIAQLKRYLSLLLRTAGAAPQANDVLTYQGSNLVQWKQNDHGTDAGLTDDDHSQYALLAGRSGGQTLNGGTDASDDITIVSTANATKGDIIFGDPSVTFYSDYSQLHRLPGLASAGEFKWGYAALDGTARTIIPDGTPDVATTCLVTWIAEENTTGTTANGSTKCDNSGTANITIGGATVQFAVAANGTLTAQRTAGANSVDIVCSVLFL